jgi:hypothetical protein
VLVDDAAPAVGDVERRVAERADGGAGQARAGRECVALVAGGARGELGRGAPGGDADVDEFDALVVFAVAVALLVRVGEGGAQSIGIVGVALLDGELEGLAGVAQLVGDAAARGKAGERTLGVGDQRLAQLAQSRGGELFAAQQGGTRDVVARPRVAVFSLMTL